MAGKVLIVSGPSLDGWLNRLAFMPVKFPLLSLYSHLRNSGVEADVLDLEVELGTPAADELPSFFEKARRLVAFKEFDIAAVACYTSYAYRMCLALGEICRSVNPDAFLAAGGYHPTSLPGDFEGTPFDAVIVGEAELALEELAKGRLPREPGHLAVVAGKPVPMESTDVLRLEDYPYSDRPVPRYAVVLSRGCPFRCEYCVEPWAGGGWRAYAPEESLRLVDRVIALHRPKLLSFHDPIFGFHRPWRRAFLDGLERRGYSTSFDMETRVDLIEDDDLETLGRLNMLGYLGVETASERMLQIMCKTTNPRRYLRRLSELLGRASRTGAIFSLNLIFNHPGETEDSVRETVDFFSALARELPEVTYRFNPFQYAFYPGSPQFGRIADYEERYGARVFWKRWWTGEPRRAHERAVDVAASRQLFARFGRDTSYWAPAFSEMASRTLERTCAKLKLELSSALVARALAENSKGAARAPC